ncbi:SoxR reducing system RseC family protein [Neptunomonas antarctica]|uniref:Positive regulator of sigma(E), RseC/MucC n=1 Tax=Neptunomonas antarctica TaxID=619304 RepID=A0A1N7N118_9GAMM|nr:SoxR reducing system RseC family protein [Neptunomonas antarctica]SIS91809.1 positive regulator of sigma(E), RseC/MucC [Neptunomonas antarctica]
MIEEHATVVDVFVGAVLIESSRTSACGQCQSKQSCGQKAISEWASSKMARIEIDNPGHLLVKSGDNVIVGIDEGSFLKASALMYLLPLVLMIVFGGVAQSFVTSELFIIVFSFIGLLAGFLGAKLLSRQLERRSQYKPVLLRISSLMKG